MDNQNALFFGLLIGVAGIAALLIPLIKSIKANYASIFVMILIEYIIGIYAAFSDFDRSMLVVLLVGWGFVTVTAAITIVGADIRNALLARPASGAAATPRDASSAR